MIFKDNLVLIHESIVWEDSSPYLMARVLKLDSANPAIQSDFSSIRYVVLERKTGKYITGADLTVTSVIFNSLQTDNKWTRDDIGYNFAFTLPSAALPKPEIEYVVTIFFTPTSGSIFTGQFRIYPERVFRGVPISIKIIEGDTYTEIIRGLPDLTTATKIWFVVKRNKYDLDSEALIKIENVAGLEILNAATAITSSDGSITVNSAINGDITILLKKEASVILKPRKNIIWAIKVLYNTGKSETIADGYGDVLVGMVQDNV